jgi:hypothetical protein
MSGNTKALQVFADGRFIEAIVPEDVTAPVTLRISTPNDPRESLVIDLPRVFFTSTRQDSFINKPAKTTLSTYTGVLKLLASLMSTEQKNVSTEAERVAILDSIGLWVHGEKAKVEMDRSAREEREHAKRKVQ